MPDDYYMPEGDDAASPTKAGQAEPGAKEGDTEKEDSGEETALLPKSLLAGKSFEPGEEVVFKIVKMYDDEIEVSYAKEDKSEGSHMDKAKAKLAGMATESAPNSNTAY